MATKHEKSFEEFNKPYESNVIGLRGIIYFAIGLFLLIIITFGLMWFLQNVMEAQAKTEKDGKPAMMLSEEERLPPEPRLQAAPGFGVDSPEGRINLELKAPQSEYMNVREQWETLWQDGQKDPKTGTVVTLPTEEAKRKFLEEMAGKQQPNAQQGENMLRKSREMVSMSSSGRTAADIRR